MNTLNGVNKIKRSERKIRRQKKKGENAIREKNRWPNSAYPRDYRGQFAAPTVMSARKVFIKSLHVYV